LKKARRKRRGSRHGKIRPLIRKLMPKSESQRVLKLAKDMNAAHKQIIVNNPVAYMQNQSILVAACKEACARYRIRWKLVEHRTIHTGEARPDAAIMLCNKVALDGRLPMHEECKGRGCSDCKHTGADALWRV